MSDLTDILRSTVPCDIPLAVLLNAADIIDDGRCRQNCRTAKENWIDGYEHAELCRDTTLSRPRLREEAEREWKRRQANTG